MKNSNSNLDFNYFHRDEGNYKIYGSIIFKNPHQLSVNQSTELIKEKLIENQYFYPKDVNIPVYAEHRGLGIFFSDWYEYIKPSLTEYSPSDPRAIEVFLKSL